MRDNFPDNMPATRGHFPEQLQDKPLSTQLYQDHRHQDDEDDEVDLRELWSVLLRRKWTIITIAFLVFATATIATLMMTPIYRASITLKIDTENTQVLDYDVEAQQQSINSKDFYQTQYELLQSRSLARRTIDQLGLENQLSIPQLEKPFYAETLGKITNLFNDAGQNDTGSTDIGFSANTQDSAVLLGKFPIEDKFLDKMTVQPVKNSQIVTVHYDDSNPELAANIANAVAENYISMNLERRIDAASYAKEFLNEQLILAKSRLLESEKELNEFARANEIVNTDDKQSLSSKRLGELSAALTVAQGERIKAESEMKQAQATADAKMLENETIEKLESKLAELERRFQADVMTYNAFNDSNIRELRGTLVKLQNEYQEKLAIYKPAYP
ncbi:MAG: GumC family protein, partial [bacterium]